MKITILGAGVIGVTTAYELVRDGHEVTVIDRQPSAGMETSFANAGLIAPGHAYAWASPEAPKNLFKSLYSKDEVFRFRPSLNTHLFRWGWQFLKECTGNKSIKNTELKFKLCHYSQKKLHNLIEELNLKYDRIKEGLLYIFRTEKELDEGAKKAELLIQNNLPLKIISREDIVEKEPIFNSVKEKIAGAIYAPTDEAGDAYQFTQSLTEICKKRGVRFLFETDINKLLTNNEKIEYVLTDKETLQADAFIVAMGSFSAKLVKSLRIFLPIYPVKGFSITLPTTTTDVALMGGGVDEHHLLAFARLGDRVRFTSIAEISNYDTKHSHEDFRYLIKAVEDLFPDVGDFSKIEYWSGLRPMTPKGTPIIGKSRYKNLFFNTGHGHLGWTMACGSARIIADIIAGKKPEISLIY